MLNVHSNEDTAVTPTRWLILLGKILKAFWMRVVTSWLKEILLTVEKSSRLAQGSVSLVWRIVRITEVLIKHINLQGPSQSSGILISRENISTCTHPA